MRLVSVTLLAASIASGTEDEMPNLFKGAGFDTEGASLEIDCEYRSPVNASNILSWAKKLAILPSGEVFLQLEGIETCVPDALEGRRCRLSAPTQNLRWNDPQVWRQIESLLSSGAGKNIQTGKLADRHDELECIVFTSVKTREQLSIYTQNNRRVSENYWDDAGLAISDFLENLPPPEHVLKELGYAK